MVSGKEQGVAGIFLLFIYYLNGGKQAVTDILAGGVFIFYFKFMLVRGACGGGG